MPVVYIADFEAFESARLDRRTGSLSPRPASALCVSDAAFRRPGRRGPPGAASDSGDLHWQAPRTCQWNLRVNLKVAFRSVDRPGHARLGPMLALGAMSEGAGSAGAARTRQLSFKLKLVPRLQL